MTAEGVTKSRIAVVTGANKGIGLEICRQLASSGVVVVLTSRDEKRGAEALHKLVKESELSDSVVYHQLDVTDPASVSAIADFVRSRFGKLDVLVNNAGIGSTVVDDVDALRASRKGGAEINWGQFVKESYESAEFCLKTNYYGAKSMVEAHVDLLKLSDSPRIINVSSSMGKLEKVTNEWARQILSDVESLTEDKIDEVITVFLRDFKDGSHASKGWPAVFPAYILSKAVMNAYTRILARKYPGFCINAVCPGFVKTDLNYQVGYLTVEEGARGPVQLALLTKGGPSGCFFVNKGESAF